MTHLRDIGEAMRESDCPCARWSWGLSSLQTGVVRDAEGKPHHPSCRCAGGVIGCRGDTLSGSLPDQVVKRCAVHGTSV